MKPVIQIALSEPYPYLDPGTYTAVCSEADFAWARQWKKWIARLVLQPEDYHGRAYIGRLCKFLGLGKDPLRPYAGPQSHFRRLLVEVNGDQPPSLESSVDIFVGVRYQIEVETVKADRHGMSLNGAHWYSIVRGIHPCKHGVSTLPTAQPVNLGHFNPSTQGTLATLTTDQHSNTVNTPLANARASTRK